MESNWESCGEKLDKMIRIQRNHILGGWMKGRGGKVLMVPLFNGPSVTFSSLKVKLNRCSLISWASCRWGKSRRSRGELWRITPPVPSIRVASFDFVPVHLTLSSKFFSKIKILDEDSQISWRYRIIIASCYLFFLLLFSFAWKIEKLMKCYQEGKRKIVEKEIVVVKRQFEVLFYAKFFLISCPISIS